MDEGNDACIAYANNVLGGALLFWDDIHGGASISRSPPLKRPGDGDKIRAMIEKIAIDDTSDDEDGFKTASGLDAQSADHIHDDVPAEASSAEENDGFDTMQGTHTNVAASELTETANESDDGFATSTMNPIGDGFTTHDANPTETVSEDDGLAIKVANPTETVSDNDGFG